MRAPSVEMFSAVAMNCCTVSAQKMALILTLTFNECFKVFTFFSNQTDNEPLTRSAQVFGAFTLCCRCAMT